MGFLYMIKTYFLTLIISTCTSYSQWQYEVCIYKTIFINFFSQLKITYGLIKVVIIKMFDDTRFIM